MTTLPPPPPGAPKSAGAMKPPPIGGLPGGAKQTVIHKEDYEHASKLPLVIAIVAIVASIALTLFANRLSAWINFGGYLLTPFIVIICTGLDSVQQRRRATTDLYFLENRKITSALRGLSFLSLLLSIPHIEAIASSIAAWVAKL